jgi:hypothetical protein
MNESRKISIVRLAVVIAAIFCVALAASPARAGHMFLEYRGELSDEYTFFRGAFDLGDLDDDGSDEMVIADDEGGFHVYHYTPAGFVPMWVSAPVVTDGHIVAVEIIHENLPGIMPKILLLDSKGTLHQIRYTGYIFEETATYEDYRPPGESGRIVVTDLGGDGRAVLIALPNVQRVEERSSEVEESETSAEESEAPIEESETPAEETEAPAEDSDTSEFQRWNGMTLYRLTASGLELLSEEELASLEEGEVYFVQELTPLDIEKLESLGSIAGRLYSGDQDDSRIGIADLDRDALYELLVSMSDPQRPIDRLEVYSEHGGDFSMRITLELPLINQMVLGDVDGDGYTEIVGLTYDGVVLVYQYDPLTVRLADGTELEWENPHKDIDGTIWLSLGGFEELGCTAVEQPDRLELSLNDMMVVLDRTEHTIMCEDSVLFPDVPAEAYETVPYLPLFSTLECLGFLYTYDPEQNLVEVEPAE